jgi:topoisomerase-4 subunit B
MVSIDDGMVAEETLKTLMGDNAEKRKDWIEENIEFTLEEEESKFIL